MTNFLASFAVSRLALGLKLLRVKLKSVFFKELLHLVHRLESVEVVVVLSFLSQGAVFDVQKLLVHALKFFHAGLRVEHHEAF